MSFDNIENLLNQISKDNVYNLNLAQIIDQLNHLIREVDKEINKEVYDKLIQMRDIIKKNSSFIDLKSLEILIKEISVIDFLIVSEHLFYSV